VYSRHLLPNCEVHRAPRDVVLSTGTVVANIVLLANAVTIGEGGVFSTRTMPFSSRDSLRTG
jgi:hypothetical protein